MNKHIKLFEEYQVKAQTLICNDCGEKFTEFKKGGFRFAKVRTKCPYCGSINIEPAPKPVIAPAALKRPIK